MRAAGSCFGLATWTGHAASRAGLVRLRPAADRGAVRRLRLLAAIATPTHCRFEQADGSYGDGHDVTSQVHEEEYGCHHCLLII